MGQNLLSGNRNLVIFRDRGFTDGKVWYESTSDVFQNGICFDYITGQKLPINKCKAGYDKAFEKLQISDEIIIKRVSPPMH